MQQRDGIRAAREGDQYFIALLQQMTLGNMAFDLGDKAVTGVIHGCGLVR